MKPSPDVQDDLCSNPSFELAPLLPREVFAEIMLVLRGALPPPVNDRPADWSRRDRAAIAGVAALLPVNGAEGRLAAQFVSLDANASEYMRMAHAKRSEPDLAFKYSARAMGMMREGKGVLKLLHGMQAARLATAADETASSCAAWVEHGVAEMMQAALACAEDDAAQILPPAEPVSVPATRLPDACAETEPRLCQPAIPSGQRERDSSAAPLPGLLHERPQHGIDTGLVARPLLFEPIDSAEP
jgi:hypothetical protein